MLFTRSSFFHRILALSLGFPSMLPAAEPPGKLLRDKVDVHWLEAGDRFYYTVNGKDQVQETWLVDAAKGEKRRLEKPEELAAIAKEEQESGEIRPSENGGGNSSIKIRNAMTETILIFWVDTRGQWKNYGEIAAGGESEQHTFAGHSWLATTKSKQPLATMVAAEGGSVLVVKPGSKVKPVENKRQKARSSQGRPNKAPQGVSAELKDNNLWLNGVNASKDGTDKVRYDGPLHWSADGKWLALRKVKLGQEHKIYIVESSPKDQLEPKQQEHDYLKPGDEIDTPSIVFCEAATGKMVAADAAAMPTPWSIESIQWLETTGEYVCLYNGRGHQSLKLCAITPATGRVRSIAEESTTTFIDYTNKVWHRILEKTNELLWMSQRDGWNHLYLIDLKSGQVKNAVTTGPWMVREVLSVDETTREIEFSAMGIYPEQDPYHLHLARAKFDGGPVTKLTASDGTHDWKFSPNKKWIIDRWSRIDHPPVVELRSLADGHLVLTLEQADATALTATGWQMPQRFVAKGRDGKTDIYGMIIRPTAFKPGQKYPVIEHIYAGPHDFFTPKTFSRQSRLNPLAEKGFILVQMDGMGTNWRGKAFHDVCFKNLEDSGFPDRKLWLKAAAAKHPEMDLTRVGIYGGSAGGQSALRALIDHHDTYHVAVSDCGCHDNRMDKIWWNEQWLSWPIDAAYQRASNTENVKRIQGHLLITWGELDSNVDPASSMQVVNALIKADKDFEMLIIPGSNHGAGESPYANRKRTEFFVKHLLGGKK